MKVNNSFVLALVLGLCLCVDLSEARRRKSRNIRKIRDANPCDSPMVWDNLWLKGLSISF